MKILKLRFKNIHSLRGEHEIDFTNELPDNWREFNLKYIPVWIGLHPEKSRVAAGLACGAL